MNWTDGHMNMVKTLTQQKRLALVAAKAKEVPAKKLPQKKKLPEVVVVEVAWLFKRLKRNLILSLFVSSNAFKSVILYIFLN